MGMNELNLDTTTELRTALTQAIFALDAINLMETDHANATVRRMARTAREGVVGLNNGLLI